MIHVGALRQDLFDHDKTTTHRQIFTLPKHLQEQKNSLQSILCRSMEEMKLFVFVCERDELLR